MRFQQAIAPMILSIICTITIFGPEKTTLPYLPLTLYEIIDQSEKYPPKVICGLIDEFRGVNLYSFGAYLGNLIDESKRDN